MMDLGFGNPRVLKDQGLIVCWNYKYMCYQTLTQSETICFSRKWIWKCHLQNGHFASASMC